MIMPIATNQSKAMDRRLNLLSLTAINQNSRSSAGSHLYVTIESNFAGFDNAKRIKGGTLIYYAKRKARECRTARDLWIYHRRPHPGRFPLLRHIDDVERFQDRILHL